MNVTWAPGRASRSRVRVRREAPVRFPTASPPPPAVHDARPIMPGHAPTETRVATVFHLARSHSAAHLSRSARPPYPSVTTAVRFTGLSLALSLFFTNTLSCLSDSFVFSLSLSPSLVHSLSFSRTRSVSFARVLSRGGPRFVHARDGPTEAGRRRPARALAHDFYALYEIIIITMTTNARRHRRGAHTDDRGEDVPPDCIPRVVEVYTRDARPPLFFFFFLHFFFFFFLLASRTFFVVRRAQSRARARRTGGVARLCEVDGIINYTKSSVFVASLGRKRNKKLLDSFGSTVSSNVF